MAELQCLYYNHPQFGGGKIFLEDFLSLYSMIVESFKQFGRDLVASRPSTNGGLFLVFGKPVMTYCPHWCRLKIRIDITGRGGWCILGDGHQTVSSKAKSTITRMIIKTSSLIFKYSSLLDSWRMSKYCTNWGTYHGSGSDPNFNQPSRLHTR